MMGFVCPVADPVADAGEGDGGVMMRSPLMHIEGFLEALTSANDDGRILVDKRGELSRYTLINIAYNLSFHVCSSVLLYGQ